MRRRHERSDAELDAVRRRIEHWRRTRQKRGRMPAELWSAAVALTEDRTMYAVARGLKISYTSLKERVTRRQAGAAKREPVKPTFVEVSAAHLLGATQLAGCVVELKRGDGSQMTVHMPAGQAVDLAGLSAAFLSHGR